MTEHPEFPWLLSRTIDPGRDWRWRGIEKLVVKQRIEVLLKEMEAETGWRILITEGYATSGHSSPTSLHYAGKAIDFIFLEATRGPWLERQPSEGVVHTLWHLARRFGFELIDEYRSPSAAATAGHLHLEYQP